MKYIEPRHYIDVVEERYIIKLCGWPQCGNELAGISKAKYHVSVKHKQVIDITERKVQIIYSIDPGWVIVFMCRNFVVPNVLMLHYISWQSCQLNQFG